MNNRRSARVLEPAYLDDVPARPLDELRAMHAECLELETEVSYVRRVAQARIDIIQAELERRTSGGSVEDLIAALPRILADPGPRGNPATSHLPLQLAPEQESEWADELAESDAPLSDLPHLDETELTTIAERLRDFERRVSDQRRALFGVIDRVEHELAQRRTS